MPEFYSKTRLAALRNGGVHRGGVRSPAACAASTFKERLD
jgi:hypothetical protein